MLSATSYLSGQTGCTPAGKVVMLVVQRHAVATVDGANDEATVLVGKGGGIAMRAGSARKVTVTVVVLCFPLGVGGDGKQS